MTETMGSSWTSNEEASLRARISDHPWYHVLELAPGIETPGMFDLRPFVDHYGIPEDLTGVRALDVGTFDGFWAFELARRGADVVGVDVDSSARYDWPPRRRPSEFEERGETWRLAREILDSQAQRIGGLTVYELEPDRVGGTFDLVFCGSILIHVRDPMLALERLASLCRGRLILCEEHSRRLGWIPKVKAAEFRGHGPHMTWWRPTARTWKTMIEVAGFDDVTEHGRFKMRFANRRAGVPHVVFHAQGRAR